MAAMIATQSSFMNSSPNHDTAARIMHLHVHGMINKKHDSSCGLQFKALTTKINATKVGGRDSSMLDMEKNSPNMVSDLFSARKDSLIFQEKVCIGIYEVGPDRTATVETLMNHVLETTAIHMKEIGLMDNGFGSEEMFKQNLSWVVAKIQMVVDRYPTWRDIVQIDTWKSAYGKNGVCCNLIFLDCETGEILVKASSFWVMMNKRTKRFSKFQNDVRAKLEQYFVDTPPIVEQDTKTWSKSEATIDEHIYRGLKPRWSDLDINRHVNHVKYIGLILESVPKTIMENYEINNVTLEYYRQCTNESVLQSITSVLANNNGEIANFDVVDCQHLLQFEIGGGSGNNIIVKGRTRWRLKQGKRPDSVAEVSNAN